MITGDRNAGKYSNKNNNIRSRYVCRLNYWIEHGGLKHVSDKRLEESAMCGV